MYILREPALQYRILETNCYKYILDLIDLECEYELLKESWINKLYKEAEEKVNFREYIYLKRAVHNYKIHKIINIIEKNDEIKAEFSDLYTICMNIYHINKNIVSVMDNDELLSFNQIDEYIKNNPLLIELIKQYSINFYKEMYEKNTFNKNYYYTILKYILRASYKNSPLGKFNKVHIYTNEKSESFELKTFTFKNKNEIKNPLKYIKNNQVIYYDSKYFIHTLKNSNNHISLTNNKEKIISIEELNDINDLYHTLNKEHLKAIGLLAVESNFLPINKLIVKEKASIETKIFQDYISLNYGNEDEIKTDVLRELTYFLNIFSNSHKIKENIKNYLIEKKIDEIPYIALVDEFNRNPDIVFNTNRNLNNTIKIKFYNYVINNLYRDEIIIDDFLKINKSNMTIDNYLEMSFHIMKNKNEIIINSIHGGHYRHFSRYSYLKDVENEIKSVYKKHNHYVEIYNDYNFNAAIHNNLTDPYIIYGENGEYSLKDIEILLKNNEIIVNCKKRTIIPINLSPLAYHHLPLGHRILSELYNFDKLNLGIIDHLEKNLDQEITYIPRIKYKNIILSRRKYIVKLSNYSNISMIEFYKILMKIYLDNKLTEEFFYKTYKYGFYESTKPNVASFKNMMTVKELYKNIFSNDILIIEERYPCNNKEYIIQVDNKYG